MRWLLTCLVLVPVAASAAPRVAVFDEPDFPYYMADPADSPRMFAELLAGIGLEVDLLSAKQLADPATFGAGSYAAYLHPYGNTFAQEAFANLRAFHQAGGCVVVPSGVPFCHLVVARAAAGWSLGAPGRSGRTVDEAHSGSAAMRVVNLGQWAGPSGPRFAVTPGDGYLLGGWLKLPADIPFHPNSRLFVRFWDAQGQFLGQDGPPMPTSACDWTEVESGVTVPARAVTADLSVQLWGAESEVLLDDVSLTRPGDPRNLAPNPSFEEAGGGWTDVGHDPRFLSHETGMGTGAFWGSNDPGGFTLLAPGEKIGLGAVNWGLMGGPQVVQTLEPASLPPEDEVIPLVAVGDPAKGQYPAAMIVHHCPQFDGAIDLWGRGNCPTMSKRAMCQVVLKGTVAALRRKGLVGETEAGAMLARVDELVGSRQSVWQPVSEPRPFDAPWPRSSRPAETVQVVDVSQAAPEDEFALTVLQGLVNRSQPRLYLLHTRYAQQDTQWLEELKLEGLKAESISAEEAWRRFGAEVRGAVVYDRAVLKEIGAYRADRLNITNMVLMLCAVNDAVPVAVDGGGPVPAGTVVAFDTRGRWETPREMYEWALDNLWPRLNHHVLAPLYPGIFYLTDYLVQHRIFTFWFGSQRTLGEQDLLERILASAPPNTPILGWWFDWMPNVQDPAHPAADCIGEGEGVQLGSAFAKFLTVTHEAANLSVHSGMPLLGLKHKPVSDPTRLDRSKVYFSFIMSDGDNLGECLMLRTRNERWDVPDRGSVPVGWSFAPATAVLAPPILNYYLRTASEADYLVGGLGIAYTNPDTYAAVYPEQRDTIYDEYARMTADSLAPLDTGALWLIGGGKGNISRYAAAGRPLRCIFPDYGTGVKRPYESVTYMDQGDVAVFRAVTSGGGDEPYVDRLEREIRGATDGVRPAFLHAFVLNWGTDLPTLREVIRRLGPDYVCVRPDELDRLYRESQQ